MCLSISAVMESIFSFYLVFFPVNHSSDSKQHMNNVIQLLAMMKKLWRTCIFPWDLLLRKEWRC